MRIKCIERGKKTPNINHKKYTVLTLELDSFLLLLPSVWSSLLMSLSFHVHKFLGGLLGNNLILWLCESWGPKTITMAAAGWELENPSQCWWSRLYANSWRLHTLHLIQQDAVKPRALMKNWDSKCVSSFSPKQPDRLRTAVSRGADPRRAHCAALWHVRSAQDRAEVPASGTGLPGKPGQTCQNIYFDIKSELSLGEHLQLLVSCFFFSV